MSVLENMQFEELETSKKLRNRDLVLERLEVELVEQETSNLGLRREVRRKSSVIESLERELKGKEKSVQDTSKQLLLFWKIRMSILELRK